MKLKRTIIFLLAATLALPLCAADTFDAIRHLYPKAEPIKDFLLKAENGQTTIIRWNTDKLGPMPSATVLSNAMKAVEAKVKAATTPAKAITRK